MTASQSTPANEVSLWLPVLYTSFGALLGFLLTRWKDWLDERKVQKRFFAAIQVELTVLAEHLKGTLKDATEYEKRFDSGERHVLHLPATFQRGIFDVQISKIKTVSDPTVIEIVQFYDKLSNLEKVKAHFTSISFDLKGMSDEEGDKVESLKIKYRSALGEVVRRLNDLIPIADRLTAQIAGSFQRTIK